MSKIEIDQIEDGLAKIDGSNIPYDTKWAHLKAGGVGDYYYTDTGLGSNFERVMVWDQGGWFWTNKSGFTSWLGLGDYIEKSKFGARNYAFVSNLLQKNVTVGSDSHGNYVTGHANQLHQTLFTNAVFEENATYTLFFRGYAGNATVRFRLYFTDATYQELFFTTSATGTPILRTMLSPANKTVDYLTATYGTSTTFRLYDLLLVKGSTFTDWIPAPEDQVSDWDETNPLLLSYIKNKPDLSQFALVSQITDNNYLESIITTNGTTAGTIYTFKRVGLSDLTLQLTAASASFSGVVTTGAQTFEGPKEFLKSPKVPNATNADEAVNKSQLDAVAGNIPADAVRTTTNQDVSGNKRFTSLKVLQSHTSSSTSAGWHRIATVEGRGYYEITINYTGGSFIPTAFVIKGFISWSGSTNQNDLQVDSLGIGSYIYGARLVRENSENFIEVYFNNAPTGNINLSVSYLKGNGNAVVSFMNFTSVPASITGVLWAESIFGLIHRGTQFTSIRSLNFQTIDFGSSQDWFQAFNERVTQFNISATTNVYTFSILLANSVQKQATLQTSATHFAINGSGVLQLNAAIAQKINDAATETWVTQQIANISIPNGQLTVNTTSDLVGGFVYLPNGNVTTTFGLSTSILNAIADGVTAYSYGDHASQGYLKIDDLNGYATQSWVNSQNFATQSQIITPNNGSFVVQGVGALTGAGSTSADSATNSIATLDLTTATKNDIQKGVTAESWGDHNLAGYQNSSQVNSAINSAIQPFIQSIDRIFRPNNAPFNLSITTKKTVVTYGVNVSGAVLNISNGSVDGDELAINGSGEWGVVVNGNLIDRFNNTGSTSLNTSALFWWHNGSSRWIQAT